MRAPLPALFASLLFAIAPLSAATPAAPDLWSHDNLAAWCIVPYDAKQRDPVDRARMLQSLGLKKLAYDYRDEHIPTFDAEIEAMRRHDIAIIAWWFPVTLDATARRILDTLERHSLHPQLWVTGWENAATAAASHEEKVEREARRIRPIADEAKRLGCTVGLYNHGGWFGEPDNQIAIIERLRRDGIANVGIVYNFHHGHDHIADFPALWSRMRPHVIAVNLNGMVRDGDRIGRKIVYLAEGDSERAMMQVIDRSGWRGDVGILNHQPDVDAKEALQKNLAGLDRLVAALRSGTP